ncbi:MAG: ATP-dependent Clp protease ATP-binding subunit ClpX, partial [Cellvibrionales bacterium]|nr:ATP-dependent Clp protease ATP-binding subunit ClpX [Cellvibrionales bacterium]
EDILLDTMYETPTKKNIIKVVIDGSVVRGESEPLIVYESPDPKTAVSE